MPEGPEIRRAADKLAKVLENQVVTEVWFAFPHLKGWEDTLAGRRIVRVEPRGKALLITFDNGHATYSHNQLYGRWDVRTRKAKPLATNRQPRMRLVTERHVATLYSASDIAVLLPGEAEHHPFLARIGPDVFDPGLTAEAIGERLREKRFAGRRLLTLMLDQAFLAGLGNYLRSEALYLAGLDPQARPKDLSDAQLRALGETILWTTAQSYATRGLTVPQAHADALKARGVPRSRFRHFVFNRAGLPCAVCGEAIEMDRPDGRRVYRCPHCQDPAESEIMPFKRLVV